MLDDDMLKRRGRRPAHPRRALLGIAGTAAAITLAVTAATAAAACEPAAGAGTAMPVSGTTSAPATGGSMSGSAGSTGGTPGMTTQGPFAPNLDPGESNDVTSIPPLHPSSFPQAAHVGFHEFQVNCSVTRVAPDDPIVSPKQPGVSHSHTFTGGPVDAATTTGSLTRGATSCTTVGDHSAYWFPTMYDGDREVRPTGTQIVYYKAGIDAYDAIRPFPRGLRFVVGNPKATAAEFQRDSRVSGWSCGSSYDNWDFPTAFCPAGNKLLVRYKAPSCWDGKHLDSPDHKAHMSYPVDGRCDAAHPVAVPMLEFKIAYPVSGDLTRLRLSSGRGYSWHADFFSAWDMPTEAALVTQCIDGGGQCDARGYDQHEPERGRVLDDAYRLIHR